MMKRREFITLLGGAAAAWPLAARAQQDGRVRRVGVLMTTAEADSESQALLVAFRQGLQKLGWIEGRNVRFDTRWAAFDAGTRQRLATELVALEPDIILAHDTPTTAALLQQTRTVPIVFALVANPIGSGFVASFPRPGGNVTGFVTMEGSLAGKWLELLKEIAPRVAPGRLVVQPNNGIIRRALYGPIQGRRCVLRIGGCDRTCSRRVRTRIGRSHTGSRTEYGPSRDE
jgi:putative ABC transport system substrate-binding protein